jgi:hypothetical protein
MSKAHNRNMERKRRRGNMTPQKANNYTIEDLMAAKRRNPQFLRSEKW